MTGDRDAGGFLPRILAVPAILGLALLVLPLVALVGRVDWRTIWVDVSAPEALDALRVSLVTASMATLVCVLVGVPLALVIAKSRTALGSILRVMVTVPLVLPPLVGGVALLYLLGRNGPIGSLLESWWGVGIPFTTVAVVIAQTFVALPFLVLALEASIRSVGPGYERTAATLGAGRWTILLRVTLPLAAPGLLSGTVLSFARALGEFGATALFAGNAPGVTQTMPLAIYAAFNGSGAGQGTALALSLLLLVTAVVALVIIRGWRPGATR